MKDQKYVALLRGVNVGGKNKVDMTLLKSYLDEVGFKDIATYINSGNIMFSSNERRDKLAKIFQVLISDKFGIDIKVLIRDKNDLKKLISSIPQGWNNDGDTKCDVMFLCASDDTKTVLDRLTIRKGIDQVRYVEGAVVWSVNKDLVSKSGMMKLPGTELYSNMTIRNVNTVRKIGQLMNT